MNAFCPASIKYREKNDECEISIIKTHTHEMDLEYLKLTGENKNSIAQKIASGISFNRILDEIRQSLYEGDELQRIHLLTRKDLLNIEKQYNLRTSFENHKNDAISVEGWVQQEQKYPVSSVLYYKTQGRIDLDIPNLNSDDFVLIIMNEAQAEILKKFGSKTLCIDGTHGLNQYGFELITLLVLDDLNQGFSCVFLLTNRTDTFVSQLFFSKIKGRIGDLNAENFMSDMDDSFFNGFHTRKESVGKFPLTSDAIQQAGSQRTSNNDIENIIISEVAKKKERVSNNDLEKAKLKDMIITIIDNATIIRRIKAKKSPGRDGITNKMLKNLPRKGLVAVANLINIK
ncbi:hypothetical protein YQE_03858, partial [Dendroctonus ponderosae]